ncbi:MAG: efflux RND transporter periplasmic adaptor subunit [Bacteroidia bacterium]
MKINIIYISLLALIGFYSCAEEDKSTPVTAIDKTNNTAKELNNQNPEFIIDSSEITIGCIGEVTVPPRNKIDITAGIDANVFDIQVLPGSKVSKGQLLARIKNRSIINLQSSCVSAKTEMQNLQADFNRKEALYNENAISEKDYLQAKALLESKLAQAKGLEAQLSYIGISPKSVMENGIQNSIALRANVNGTVISVNCNEGAFVAENQSIFTLIDGSHLHLDLEVFAKDAVYLKEGQPVEFTINGGYEKYTAEIMLISAELNHQSNTLMAHAEIDEHGGNLIAGSVAQAKILAGKQKRYLLAEKWVEHTAIKTFCNIDNQKVELELGNHENGFYEILNYNLIRAKLN